MSSAEMPLVRMPRDGVARLFLVWFLIGAGLRILQNLQPNPAFSEDPSRAAGRFVMDWLGPYLFGALWSGFPVVGGIALVCVFLFAFAILTPRLAWRSLAQSAVGILILLSLFTLWIEPWLKDLSRAANLLMIVLGLFSVIPEIVVSIVWALAWGHLSDQIDRELPTSGDG